MYESFYGLSEKPFTLLPDPSFLYLGKKHRTALTMLQYGLVSSAGFTVITGEVGSGKTTLLRQLLRDMDEDLTVGLISNTHSAFGELLQWVLMAFGLDYRSKQKVELYEALTEFMIGEYAQGRRTVLIIDEAQNLSAETMEELRMLSNINADKNLLLQLILVGQPELRAMLQRTDLRQFAQRISVSYHLEALNEQETLHYIRHRVFMANGDPDLFDDGACAMVHEHSGGVPRVINIICDTALVYGFAEEKTCITAETILDVVRDRREAGIGLGEEEKGVRGVSEQRDDGDPGKGRRVGGSRQGT